MWFLSILKLLLGGGDPIKTATDALVQAHKDGLTAANDSAKLAANLRIESAEKALAAAQQAVSVRLATAGYREQRFLTFVAGLVAITHWAMIGIGTTFAAPLGWWWLDWTLHIPPFPAPFADYEGEIILSFFGLVGVQTVGQAIAGAVAIRGTRNDGSR